MRKLYILQNTSLINVMCFKKQLSFWIQNIFLILLTSDEINKKNCTHHECEIMFNTLKHIFHTNISAKVKKHNVD